MSFYAFCLSLHIPAIDQMPKKYIFDIYCGKKCKKKLKPPPNLVKL